MRILLAIALNALALAAATLLPGLSISGFSQEPGAVILAYLFVGAVFGVINVTLKPIIQILSLPITCLTLGLFAIVINAAMLSLTSWLVSPFPGVEFEIRQFFFDAILGAIIISIVSGLLNRFVIGAARA
ncbi:phage holin family protein [Nesterenkonia sedimenti]|uniref:phage holin family protein n=1 Tax=Nesterenkonia sedimenti TaxID=1463632 RepID=UPI002D21B17C|nr:phage holin family protein [Nesterenkonia sedimenti]